MSVVPPPYPVEDLIVIPLALAAVILWLAVSIERRFHRWPWVSAGVLLLISLLGVEQVWPLLVALARMVQRLLEGLGLLGLLALILLSVATALGYSALRAWLQRRC